MNVLNPATVGGSAYSNSTFDAIGTRETLALTTTPGAAPISVAGNDGKVLVVPVMPGNQFYMSVAAPTHWDLYARPYYRCRIRIIISGTNSTLIYNPNTSPQMSSAANAGAITVGVNFLPDTNTPGQPDQILGFLDSAATAATGSPYTQISYADPTRNFALLVDLYEYREYGKHPGPQHPGHQCRGHGDRLGLSTIAALLYLCRL